MTTIIIITPPVKHASPSQVHADPSLPEEYEVQVVGDADLDVIAVLQASLSKSKYPDSDDATSD